MNIPLSKLIGYMVVARNKTIGTVEDLYLNDREWDIRYMVVDISHWYDSRNILIPPAYIKYIREDDRKITISIHPSDIRQCETPAMHPTVSHVHENEMHSLHQWPFYWRNVHGASFGPRPVSAILEKEKRELHHLLTDDSHASNLRSFSEMLGYRIEAYGVSAGKLSDLLMDEETMEVKSAIVNIQQMLSYRKVTVPWELFSRISWYDKCVSFRVPKRELDRYPSYITR
jgi:sporulation protein YlmC with PRC-barrel domain